MNVVDLNTDSIFFSGNNRKILLKNLSERKSQSLIKDFNFDSISYKTSKDSILFK